MKIITGLFVLSFFFQSGNVNAGITQTDHVLTLDKGETHVEFKKGKPFDTEYRVFGITINKQPNTPLEYIDAFMPMLPLERVREIYRTGKNGQQCERQATQEMKLIPVIIPDKKIRNKIFSYESKTKEGQFALRIKGVYLIEKKHTFKGLSGNMNSGTLSLKRCLLLEDAEIVPF